MFKSKKQTPKFLAIIVFSALVVVSNSRAARAQPPKQNTLNTGNVQITANLVNIGCEGTNCVGLTIDNTAGGIVLTSSKYAPTVADQAPAYSRAQVAQCYNQGAKIWITDNPSITLATARGRAIADGTSFQIYGFVSIQNFHAIRDAGVSSTLFCDYYKQP